MKKIHTLNDPNYDVIARRFLSEPPKGWGVIKYPDKEVRWRAWFALDGECQVRRIVAERSNSLKWRRVERANALKKRIEEQEKQKRFAITDDKVRTLPDYLVRIALFRDKIVNSFSAPRGFKGHIKTFCGTSEEKKQIDSIRVEYRQKRENRSISDCCFFDEQAPYNRQRYTKILNERLEERVIEAIPQSWCRYVSFQHSDEPKMAYVKELQWSSNRNRKWPSVNHDVLIIHTNRKAIPVLVGNQEIRMGTKVFRKLKGHKVQSCGIQEWLWIDPKQLEWNDIW